ncbi:hypothetical protein ACFW1F_06945 [Streptomyces bungoensis]|uniref:PIN-like domain-containing protein n=1 Tax=Streptomyces bungoensis TaxID=285568 RepID=UPI0034319FA8
MTSLQGRDTDLADVFPDDGQDVPDEEWITHGLDRSWVPLSKDGRIKTRGLEIRPVLEREAAVEKGGPAAYAVRHDRIERTWPRESGAKLMSRRHVRGRSNTELPMTTSIIGSRPSPRPTAR